jgi:hypothetical protein
MRRGSTTLLFGAGLGLALVAVAVAVVAATASTAEAQAVGVSVEAVPSTIRLPADGEVPVAVVATNPTSSAVLVSVDAAPLAAVVLNRPPTPSQPASPSPFPPQVIVAGGSARWDVTVRRAAAGVLPATLLLRVTSQGLDAAGAPAGAPQLSALGIDVQPEAPEDVASIATATVETAVNRIDDRRGGDVFVAVQNRSSGPISASVTSRRPTDIDIDPQDDPSDVAIPAGRTATVRYHVQGAKQVEAGRQLLLFEVTVRWGNPGQERSATLLASHPVDVGVFGDSELSSLLQVPLLLLPGLFGLAAIAILWRLGVRARGTAPETFPLDVKAPEFWFFGIVISATALTADGLEHGRLGFESLLVAYGSRDVLVLTVFGVVLSALVWLAICLASYLYVRRGLVKPGDTELAVIRKLGSDPHRSLWVDKGTQNAVGGRTVFVVGHNWRRTTVMVCPEIVVVFRDFGLGTQEVEQRVAAQLGRFGSAKRLAEILQPAIDAGQVRLDWRPAAGVSSVQPAGVATVAETGDQGPLVVL